MPTPKQSLPPVPQTGRRIMLMPIKHEEQLLSHRHDLDHADPFASDSDDNVRRLGRLALRRAVPDASDAFVLGDLCAKLSMRDETLLITYVGKALIAYRRAGKQSPRQADRELAAHSVEAYIAWTIQVAGMLRTPRNIAVALWAAAELTVDDQPEALRKSIVTLAASYASSLPPRHADRETVETPAVNLRGTVEVPMARSDAVPFVDPAESLLNQYESAAVNHEEEDDLPLSLLQPLSNLATDASAGYHATPDDVPDSDDLLPDEPDMLPTTPFQLPSANDPTSDLMPPSAPSSRKPSKVTVRPLPDETGDYNVYDWLIDRDPLIQGKRYEIRRILRGGMGIIYICRDHHTGQAVAIKTFQGRFLSNDRAAARFEQEALAWIRLEKHPNIVQARKIQRFGDAQVTERPHIILEYISHAENLSADLKSWIEAGVLTLDSVLSIALDVCRGMMYATTKIPTLVHRDLKPGNILMRYDGVAKVTDFGLVRTMDRDEELALDVDDDDRLTRAGAIVGTAAYMSPEQTYARPTDVRSDIYAFGAILYEMITRTQVFKAHTFEEWMHAHRAEIPRFPESMPIRAPIPLRRLIMDCLDKQPGSRPPTWSAVMNALSAIYEQEVSQPVPEVDESELEIEELMDKAYGLSELGYHEEAVRTYDRALEIAPVRDQSWIWGRKANTLRFNGDYDAARAAFEQALILDPGQAWLWHAQGVLLERMGQPNAALESYQKALGLRPTDQRYLLSVARQLNTAGDYEAALSKLDEVLIVAPTLAEAYTERAVIFGRLGRHDEALAAYERTLELRPNDGWSWYGKAKVLRRLKRLDDALIAARTATDRLPASKWTWLLAADLNTQLGKPEDGLDAIAHVIQLDPDFVDGWRKQGMLLDALNRPDEALTAFNHALQLQAGNPGAAEAKMRLLQKLQRHQDALGAIDQALSESPDSEPLLRRKFESLIALRQDLEAALVLDRLTALNPQEAAYWATLGKVRRRLKQTSQAEVSFRRALELAPNVAPVWNDLGLLLTTSKRPEEALTCFEQAIQLDRTRPWYWYNKANALYALDHYVESLDALESVFSLDERFLDGWIKRGQALRKLGRFKEAVEALDEAIDIAPTHAWAWNQRGLVLADSGRHTDALTSYEQALKLDADNVWFHLNQIDPLLALGRREEALNTAENAARLQPASTLPLIRKGAVLRLMNRHEEALEVYERILTLNSKEFGGWYGKARSLAALNHSNEALASLARLTAYYPNNPSVWVWYGDLLLEREQARDALSAFNQALLLEPGNSLAQRRRDEAKKLLGGG